MAVDVAEVTNALEGALGVTVSPALSSSLRRAVEAWPAITMNSRAFASRLIEVSGGAGLEQRQLADLLLAQGCIGGDAAALAAFDGLMADVEELLTRQTTATLAQEATQQTRSRLLVKVGNDAPKLAAYDGRGPLFGFLRMTAVNVLRNLLSSERRSGSEGDDALAAMPDTADLEAQLVRADQQAHFRRAFRDAVKTLTPRQRALLRFSMLDGLSIDELAPMYQAHRSSLARWLAEAKELLAARTRELLVAELRMAAEDVDSLIRSAQNQLDVSLSRVLRESVATASP